MQLTVVRGSIKMPPPGPGTWTFTNFEEEEHPNPFKDGKPIEKRFKLIFTQGQYTQLDWCTPSLHEKSKLFEIVTAILGEEPTGTIKLEDLKGEPIGLIIKLEAKDNGKARTKIVGFYSVVPKNENHEEGNADVRV